MVTLRQAYDELAAGIPVVFASRGDEELSRIAPYDFHTSDVKEDIIPGSFNPLHAAHKAIYESVDNPAFELFIRRANKPDLTFEEVSDRLKQFDEDTLVYLTNAGPMVAKIRLFGNCNFHIGADVAKVMYENYQAILFGTFGNMFKTTEIGKLRATFFVYDRVVDGKLLTLDDIIGQPQYTQVDTIHNFIRMPDLGEELACISSTQIRESRR